MALAVRIHGRGGQGVVTAAELLSVAAFGADRYAQAVPSFGSERTGAPVVAYCRIDDHPIRTREPIESPDVLLVQDATLLGAIDVFAGLRPSGLALVNSERTAADLAPPGFATERIRTVPATRLALEHTGRPVPNAVLLGGFAALGDRFGDPVEVAIGDAVSLDALTAAIRRRFIGQVAERNAAAAEAAYLIVRRSLPVDVEVGGSHA